MESMITTMVLTSSTGLSIGFFIWFLFSENHLVATLIAIGSAAFIGMFIGMKFGIKCQVEGFFSGLMASMMGIMLIMMFNVQDSAFLLMVGLAFLCSMTIFSVARQFELPYKLLVILCITVVLVFGLFPKEVIVDHHPKHHSFKNQILLI